MKSFHIITFGCQMNEHDSERMTGILEVQGYASTSDVEDAEMVILNTCSIREKAEQKFFSELGRLKKLKDERPNLTIAVAGCIAQQEGKSILSRAPYVDMVFGPSDIAKLSDMVDCRLTQRVPLINISGDSTYHHKRIPAKRTDRVKAWVSIMYGCDNFCSYCVVPYLRGRERSRLPEHIVNEVHDLARRGYKEVTLLGQNVNSYGKGLETAVDFPSLLKEIDSDTGIERIRFVTSHPKDLSDTLISSMGILPKVCESLHLPVQSGSDSILEAMNRKYTRTEYIEKISKLRASMPDLVLTTDIIVGFPGETEQDFERTVSLLEEVRYDGIFAFKYSKRPGTDALKLCGHVPEGVKEERLSCILGLQKGIAIEKNRELVGSIQQVLIDGFSKKGETVTGRTRGNKAVNIEGQASLIGTVVNVTITAAGANSLTGTLCE